MFAAHLKNNQQLLWDEYILPKVSDKNFHKQYV